MSKAHIAAEKKGKVTNRGTILQEKGLPSKSKKKEEGARPKMLNQREKWNKTNSAKNPAPAHGSC